MHWAALYDLYVRINIAVVEKCEFHGFYTPYMNEWKWKNKPKARKTFSFPDRYYIDVAENE